MRHQARAQWDNLLLRPLLLLLLPQTGLKVMRTQRRCEAALPRGRNKTTCLSVQAVGSLLNKLADPDLQRALDGAMAGMKDGKPADNKGGTTVTWQPTLTKMSWTPH